MVLAFIFTRYPPPGRRIRARLVQAFIFARYPPPGRRIRARLVQAFIFTRYPPPGRRIRTATGPDVYRHALFASRKAYLDPEWSRRSSPLAIRRQEGVSGPDWSRRSSLLVYRPSGRRIRTLSGPGVHLHSLSAARKAYPGPTRPGVHLHSLSAARKAYPGPTRPGVHLHSLSAARKAYPDPEWSSRSSSLAIRCQEGVSGHRVVQPVIFTRYPLPGRRIRTPSGPAVHLHSLSAARKAYPDPEWSRRSSSLAIRCQEGVSGHRVVQPFIFIRYPPPGRRIRTPSGPGVHLHSLSAARKAYPDPEWSSRSSSLAIRCQEGVSGPRVVQAFIFTRYPLPGRRIGAPSGPAVHLHSLSAARKAYPDPTGPGVHLCSSIGPQEGVYGPEGLTVLLNSPIRRSDDAKVIRIADGPVVLVSSPICHQGAVSGSQMRSAVRCNSPIRRQGFDLGPRGCSSCAPHSPICRQRGVSAPREGEPLISTRLSAPKVTHPDRGGTHRRPRTPQADRPPHPTRSWAAAPGPPHCPRAGMGVAARPLQAIPRDAGARNALHSEASPVARPCFVLRRGVIPRWP